MFQPLLLAAMGEIMHDHASQCVAAPGALDDSASAIPSAAAQIRAEHPAPAGSDEEASASGSESAKDGIKSEPVNIKIEKCWDLQEDTLIVATHLHFSSACTFQ
jgi:hypothetical protein